MPAYDYQCSSCKKTYELRESFSAPLEHTCQKCGKGTAKRLLSAPLIVFKGSGWYATDSRTKTAATSDTDSGTPDAGGEDSPAEKPAKESKPKKAAKSESAPAPAASSSTPSSSGDTAAAAS